MGLVGKKLLHSFQELLIKPSIRKGALRSGYQQVQQQNWQSKQISCDLFKTCWNQWEPGTSTGGRHLDTLKALGPGPTASMLLSPSHGQGSSWGTELPRALRQLYKPSGPLRVDPLQAFLLTLPFLFPLRKHATGWPVLQSGHSSLQSSILPHWEVG